MNDILSSFWNVSIDEELRKNPLMKKELINDIQNWILTQKHLPKIPGTVTFF